MLLFPRRGTNNRMLSRALPLVVITLGLCCSGVLAGHDVIDVLEGQDITLECRFDPDLVNVNGQLFWIRTEHDQHDNVAIGDIPFSPGYTVVYEPTEGRYDLMIRNTTYDRDNANFECRKVESISGNRLHSSTVDLVVLLQPSPPILVPIQPTVTEGKPFNLTCSSVGGSPPPTINWYRINGDSAEPTDLNSGGGELMKALYLPGRDRNEPTSSVLTVVPKKEDGDSSYRCTVWNRAIDESDMMETSTSIDVNYFPRVEVGPENPIKVERDETAELKCEVDSKPTVSEVKWMRDGRFINTNFRHMIPRANVKDAGPYICSADNGLGQVGKAELQLDVLFGPEVTVPTQKEFAEGEEVVVECQVSSNPRTSAIVWTKEEDPEFRQTGSTLRLPGTNPAAVNNGRYTCSATNIVQPTGRQKMERHGNATIAIAVRHAPGSAFITPENPTALEGGTVTLECGARPPGFPLPSYRWWREGSESIGLATGSSFTIDTATLGSAGRYFCQPTNEIGSGSVAEVLLNVYQEPKMNSQLQDSMVKRMGDTGFHVICSAVGKPKPAVTWFKDGEPIEQLESNLYQISVTEQEVRPNEAYNVLSTLKFVGPERMSKDHLMATDRGRYTCEFVNEVGTAESTMLLRIEHSPVVRHQHNKVAADLGETARITCQMQAYPTIRFEWSKGNTQLTPRHPYYMNTTELGDDIYEGVLEIADVDDSSYDEYACKASNQLGAQKTLITLQAKGRPEKPRDVQAVQVESNFVLLSWDEGFDGGYNTTTYNVEYKEIGEGSAKYSDCRWRNPCNISILEQHTRYQLKVKAVNLRGDSDWSRDISVTTAVDVDKIPKPVHVYYETSSQTVSFNVVNYPLGLVAKIELENPDGSWQPYRDLGMDDQTYGEMRIVAAAGGERTAVAATEDGGAALPTHDDQVIGIRIRVCLNTDEKLCGQYSRAEVVEVREYAATGTGTAGLPQGGVIAIAVVASLLGLVVLVLIVKCCFCSQPAKPKKITKEDITAPNHRLNGGVGTTHGLDNHHHSTVPNHNNPYNSFGLDNKGVSAKDTADSPDIIKSQMYGYNYAPSMPAAQVPTTANTVNPGYDQQSSSNSNNGGSVNSQDSLWNVKHPNGEVMGVQGYLGQYGYGDPQQYPAPQQQQQQQQQYNYEEYAHYPHPEEYMNERNRGYFHNGEQYAMPAKQQSRHRLDSDYSPYGDVSGLPDPYTGHDISDELRHQAGLDAMSHTGLSLQSHETDLSHGPPPPEGYSTPSRRVIREIIV